MATSRGLELRGGDTGRGSVVSLYQDGVSKYVLTIGPYGAPIDECPIVVDARIGRKPWVERSDVVTMHDVRAVSAILRTLGFTDELLRTAIGKLHVLALKTLESQGMLYEEHRPKERLPSGGLRMLHALNGSLVDEPMRSERGLLEMVRDGYMTVEMTPKGRAVVEESVRTRKRRTTPVGQVCAHGAFPVLITEPLACAACRERATAATPELGNDEVPFNPLGMRVCEACGRETRKTTAGCDHCDLEDK